MADERQPPTHPPPALVDHGCNLPPPTPHPILQIVFGLERLVDMTIARSIPQVAYGTTIAIRFVNNVIGGENFIDMARWAGVQ